MFVSSKGMNKEINHVSTFAVLPTSMQTVCILHVHLLVYTHEEKLQY